MGRLVSAASLRAVAEGIAPDAIATTLAAIDRASSHLNVILTAPQRGCDDRAFTAAHDAQNALAGARLALGEVAG